MKNILFIAFIFIFEFGIAQLNPTSSNLKVSENGRYFIKKADNSPFFWMGDTGWGIFQFIPLEEAYWYLEDRKAKGFNGFLGSFVFHFGNKPNYYGEKAWLDDDPLKPNEKYFENADLVLNKAVKLDLFVGLLPSWGDKVTTSKLLNLDNAYRYGHYLGNRYKKQNTHIIWVIGGDSNPKDKIQEDVYRKIAEGIADGVNGEFKEDGSADYTTTLMTYHPQPKAHNGSSSTFFHQDEWLDFNMLQTSHHKRNNPLSYLDVAADYQMDPPKPTLDAEPPYEDHGVSWNLEENGYFNDQDIRKAAYWSVLAGAAGHIYGSHTVWQFASSTNPFDSFASSTRGWWNEEKDGLPKAKDLPGAFDMKHLKDLMLSRPYLSRIPDQDLLGCFNITGKHVQASRDAMGSYVFIYFPSSNVSCSVNASLLSGKSIKAWWFSPRDGKVYDERKNISPSPFLIFEKEDRIFTPPGDVASEDWVLVLDDAAKNYAVPGQGK